MPTCARKSLRQYRNRWNIISTRWIDINKGDDANPVYRSRLVGKGFNDGLMDGLFAATPPLEALRSLVHEAATVRSSEEMGSKVTMANDVARAFFEAPAIRNVCIKSQRRTSQRQTCVTTRLGTLG